MARKILNVATFGLAGLVAPKLFGKKKSAPAPTEAPVPTMPLPDDQAVALAKKQAIIRQMSRGGRSSTILTGDSGSTLGGY